MNTGKGINENNVPAAEEAITSFKNDITNLLDSFKSEVDFSTSFIGGEQATAISGYYSKIMDAIDDTFTFLDSFTNALNEAREAYKQEAEGIATEVNNATGSVGTTNG